MENTRKPKTGCMRHQSNSQGYKKYLCVVVAVKANRLSTWDELQYIEYINESKINKYIFWPHR